MTVLLRQMGKRRGNVPMGVDFDASMERKSSVQSLK